MLPTMAMHLPSQVPCCHDLHHDGHGLTLSSLQQNLSPISCLSNGFFVTDMKTKISCFVRIFYHRKKNLI